jgi:hypothetical protein
MRWISQSLCILGLAGFCSLLTSDLPAQEKELQGGIYGGGGGGLKLLRKVESSFTNLDDQQQNDGSFYQAYVFKLVAGRTYYVRMSSDNGDFDPFFWIRGTENLNQVNPQTDALFSRQASGKELWCQFKASRNRQVLLIANTRNKGETGPYTLEVYTK